MSIVYSTIECNEEEHEDWRSVVEKWAMIRPDWKHKTEHDDNGDGDFLRHYYNIQIHNKKDLIDVFELFSALNIACPQAKIEWHNKVKDAAVSFKATNDGFRVYGGPNMYEVENRAVATIKAIKDLVKNY